MELESTSYPQKLQLKTGKNKGPKILMNAKSRNDQTAQCHFQSLSIVDDTVCHPDSPRKTLLERVWRKGNSLTLLVGMQTNGATMENSAEILLKTGNRTAIRPSNPTAGLTHWGNET